MKYKIIFLAIVFLGLGSYYFVRSGLYPVAIVNSTFIWSKSYREHYNAALIYYQNLFANYSKEEMEKVNIPDFLQELRRATLDKLIENVLIYGELENKVGKDLSSLVERKLPAFEDPASSVYGLSPAQFKEMVLVPQAQREILEGRLFLNKQTMDDWLLQARSSAKVFILSSSFTWNGSEVVKD